MIKTYKSSEIDACREASKISSMVLDEVIDLIEVGNTTEDIDNFCFKRIKELGATPAPLFYRGFPKVSCTSLNHVICHGIPSKDKLLKKVDIVFTTSGPLYESRKKLHSNVFLTPNGVEFNLFNKVKSNVEVLNDMAYIPYPIIGYIGRVRNWLDFELLKYLSGKQPNWSIVFIGPCSTDEGEVREFISKTKSNIFFIDEKKHKYIPRYLNIVDVCILPFKANNLCNSINPLKLGEYLAVGKPVVSSKLNSLEAFSNVIFLEDTKEDFVNRIDNILNNINNGYIRKRLDSGVELAKKHSWKTITKEIADILTAESHKIH